MKASSSVAPPAILRPAQIQSLAPVRPVPPAPVERVRHTSSVTGRPYAPRAADGLPASASPMKALAGVLLLLPLVVIPVFMLWFAGRAVLVEHSALDRYRQVPATVTYTAVERRASATSHATPAWVPRVGYRFEVKGMIYDGDHVTPLDVGGTERWARKHIDNYRVGERIEAYYDPQDPRRSFLERRGTPALTATFFLPVPLLALALLWASRALRKRQGSAAALRIVR